MASEAAESEPAKVQSSKTQKEMMILHHTSFVRCVYHHMRLCDLTGGKVHCVQMYTLIDTADNNV